MIRPDIWRCGDCDHIMAQTEIIRVSVPHPKHGGPIYLSQCPECGECQNFTNLCDEPDCQKEANCGWPSPDGYRRTCYDHKGKRP